MKRSDELKNLHAEISMLRAKQAEELILLKAQFHITIESLRPLNLVKNTLAEFVSSPPVKTTVVNSAIGVTTGYLAKLALMGATRNPVTKIFGALLQFAVAGFVSKHSDGIKSTGEYLMKRIFKRREKSLNRNV
jgi:hypothetical protein